MTSSPALQTTTTPKRASKMSSNQSLNHLLNFSLPPRQAHVMQSLPRRSKKIVSQTGFWNKERFVNAQYRFVMNPTGDYTVHFADPDIFFQWPDILQVIIPRSSALASAASGSENSGQDEGHISCPICLSTPTAPMMTKCGHVFCFPCILHYLNTSDNVKWIRCPICFDAVNERQLKSVKWFDGPPPVDDEIEYAHPEASSSSSALEAQFMSAPHAGSSIRMRLMHRPQITTLALPRSPTWPSDLLPPHQAPFHFLPDVYDYAKFMLATPAYLIENLTRDLDELAVERRSLAAVNDDLGLIFVDAAEVKLRNQMAKAAALETPLLRDAVDKALRDQHEIESRFSYQDLRRREAENAGAQPSDTPHAFLATQQYPGHGAQPYTSHHGRIPDLAAPMSNARNPRQRRNINPPPPSTSTYYYYQAASGLPLFLHPLDIKILFSHFHGYSNFPDTITVRVDAVTESTVNDDLRKRCKYLGHMPEGADVVFIEADMEGVVDQEGLKNFEGALKMRRARRREKGKKDDKARARAEEKEREKISNTYSISTRTPIPYIPQDMSELTVDEAISSSPPAPVQAPGVWGTRSFASAAISASPGVGVRASQRGVRTVEDDDWDVDAAWDELEQRGGGRKKRGNKLVVLGGGGGRRR